MAKLVKITQLPELGLTEPNLAHIQESYLRQVAHGTPLTAKKKNKAAVTGTGAKWFRQKGTGRARQGERKNPHLYGGGLAFPPTPRVQTKGLNKRVRISALRSAVLMHVANGSAYEVQGKDFAELKKTREVSAVLNSLLATGDLCLVLPAGAQAWLASRNIAGLASLTPQQLNVRDLLDSASLVFTTAALAEYKELLKQRNAPEAAEAVAVPAETEAGGEE